MTRTNLIFLIFFGFIGVLFFVQYLAHSRERGRVVMCQKRLMELGRAGQEYEGNIGHLPPGTLGQPDGISWAAWSEPLGENSWQRVPNTSVLSYLHSFLETPSATLVGPEALSFDQGNFNWSQYVADMSAREQGFQREPAFLCPADVLPDNLDGIKFVSATQPVALESDGVTGGESEDLGLKYWSGTKPLAPANYLGNGGASGGACNVPDSPLASFIGPFRSRSRTTGQMVVDGKSVTIMLGEGLGSAQSGQTTEKLAWAMGGIGIARGEISPASLDDPRKFESTGLLGNSHQATSRGFSSRHVAGVNFVMLGGEFQLVTRDISPIILLSMSGIADGAD